MSPHARDVAILGGGLAGLTAGSALGNRAVVLESERRAGGLVRTSCWEGFWFDHVIHLLYFQDAAVERRVRALLGPVLAPCEPSAWVVTEAGVARFPIQMHLGHLDPAVRDRILGELEGPDPAAADRYDELLEASFGPTLCELFFFPYNRKMWKRELADLAPAGFSWNIHRPDREAVQAGAVDPDAAPRGYNAGGTYPRPGPEAPVRGMEVLTAALAGRCADLRLGHRVTAIEPARRQVQVEGRAPVSWQLACMSTLPLPLTMSLCRGAPTELVEACRNLKRNLVYSVALRIRGPRPSLGHWRYYPDLAVVFTRLVFLHEFDPLLAPDWGWPLLAEVTHPAEGAPLDVDDLARRVARDAHLVGALDPDCEVLGAHVIVADPAYVVFTRTSQQVVEAARAWLAEAGVATVGRYGRWEYSGMSTVMRDAHEWARNLLDGSRPDE